LEQKEQAYFSQKLATIKRDVPIDYHLETCEAHDFDTEKVTKLCEKTITEEYGLSGSVASLWFFSTIRFANYMAKPK
jgi:5'-3' exonuclease